MLVHHLLIFIVGIVFFSYVTILGFRKASKTKRDSDYIMPVATLCLVLAAISVFSGNWILVFFFLFVLALPLAVIGFIFLLKNPPRPIDFMKKPSPVPFLTTKKMLELASKIGLEKTIILVYSALATFTAVILLAISYPYGLDTPDILAFIIIGPAFATYLYYNSIKQEMSENLKAIQKRKEQKNQKLQEKSEAD